MKNLFILILAVLLFVSCDRLVDPDRLTDTDDRKDEPVDDRDWDNDDRDDDNGDKDSDVPCFRVLFPRAYVLADGTVIKAESPQELQMSMMEWRRANPNIDPDPQLKYPVTIAWGDQLIRIESQEMMNAYKKRCEEMRDRDDDKDDRDGDRDNDRDEDDRDRDGDDEDDEDDEDEDGRDNSDDRRR